MRDERQAREFFTIEEDRTVVEEMLEEAALRDFQRADFPERDVDDVFLEPQTSLRGEDALVGEKNACHAAAEEPIEGGMVEQEQENMTSDECGDGCCMVPAHECGAECRAEEIQEPRNDNQKCGHAILHPMLLDEEYDLFAIGSAFRVHREEWEAARCR